MRHIPPAAIAQSALRDQRTMRRLIPHILKKTSKVWTSYKEFDIAKAVESVTTVNANVTQRRLQQSHPFHNYAAQNWIIYTSTFRQGKSIAWGLWKNIIIHGHELAQNLWKG